MQSTSIRVGKQKASDTRSSQQLANASFSSSLLLSLWAHKVCQPGSRDFEWRSPVYSLFAFHRSNGLRHIAS